MNPDTPCTDFDRKRIVEVAADRVHYLRWIAKMLLVSDDKTLRVEASAQILQLIGKDGP